MIPLDRADLITLVRTIAPIEFMVYRLLFPSERSAYIQVRFNVRVY